MTHDEFTAALAVIGWTTRSVAFRLGISPSRTWRWAHGKYPIPDNVAAWLRRLVLLVESAGLPEGWKLP